MTFEQLTLNCFNKKSCLCVGLDPILEKIHPSLFNSEKPIFHFNKAIIDLTKHVAIAYKPNLAFYEAYGSQGIAELEETINYIPDDIFKIADAKRGDLGNTAERYARAYFEHFNFDAITLSPYLGFDSIEPFLSYKNKFVIVLINTSNIGSSDFQTKILQDSKNTLYLEVLEKCLSMGSKENMMFVVGANNSEAIQEIRKLAPENFLLIPGLGAQGGRLTDIVNAKGTTSPSILANYSRQLLYTQKDENPFIEIPKRANLIQKEMAELFFKQSLKFIL